MWKTEKTNRQHDIVIVSSHQIVSIGWIRSIEVIISGMRTVEGCAAQAKNNFLLLIFFKVFKFEYNQAIKIKSFLRK